MSTDTGAVDTDAPAPVPAEKARYYGFSALVSGFARMWRATPTAVPAIVLNAAVQAAIIWANPQVGWTPSFVLAVVGSAAALLLAGAVLAAGAYESAAARVRPGVVMRRMLRNFPRFALWLIVQAVLVTVGAMFYGWPGAIVAWVLVYLPIAAMDDSGNPLVSNFRAIGRHPFRWIVTGIIIALLLTLGSVLAALNTFFIAGWVASGIAMLVGGLFSWWYLTTWACLYRSRSGDEGPPVT